MFTDFGFSFFKPVSSPAYKGIPLACSTVLELHRLDPSTWSSVSYSFNRKEIKDHGEGGAIVGASLKGKNVLVIDDVITAGTAMRETIGLVGKEGGTIVGFVVALDRMERMPTPAKPASASASTGAAAPGVEETTMSAIGQIRMEYGVQTTSIVTLDDLIVLLRQKGDVADMERLEEYHRRYGAVD